MAIPHNADVLLGRREGAAALTEAGYRTASATLAHWQFVAAGRFTDGTAPASSIAGRPARLGAVPLKSPAPFCFSVRTVEKNV